MARTDDEVIDELRLIYAERFSGKSRQRFLISWSDIRALYGFKKLFATRFARLVERAYERNLYLFDMGEGENGRMVAVLRCRTVDRWRRVPRNIIRDHLPPPDATDEPDEDDEDE